MSEGPKLGRISAAQRRKTNTKHGKKSPVKGTNVRDTKGKNVRGKTFKKVAPKKRPASASAGAKSAPAGKRQPTLSERRQAKDEGKVLPKYIPARGKTRPKGNPKKAAGMPKKPLERRSVSNKTSADPGKTRGRKTPTAGTNVPSAKAKSRPVGGRGMFMQKGQLSGTGRGNPVRAFKTLFKLS